MSSMKVAKTITKKKTVTKIATKAIVIEKSNDVVADTSKNAKPISTKGVSLGKMALASLKKRKSLTTKTAVEPKVDILAQDEEQIQKTRRKDLKNMPVTDLKSLLESKGLHIGNKEDMIQTLLKHEAKARTEARAYEKKVKVVLDKIKTDLQDKSATELKELCGTKGLKVGGGKDERITRLLDHARSEGEVERILRENAQNERRDELAVLDKATLLKRCEKAKIDPLVHEVMVERLFSHELSTEALPKHVEFQEPAISQDQLAKKTKQLNAKAIDELKELAHERGIKASKKDDLVRGLVEHTVANDAEVARKKELRAMGKDGLKKLATNIGADTNNVATMIDAVLASEATAREIGRKQKAIVAEIEAFKKDALSSKQNPELKELCGSKGLKIGGSKEEKVERLLQAARDAGEIEEERLVKARAARREELVAMSKAALKALCDRAGLDTLIKEVMVERLISNEFGMPAQPQAKKARTA